MYVHVNIHHIRSRHLYVKPTASTFLDKDTMERCIKKAVDWCKDLPSHYSQPVRKIQMHETIGVTLKDGVWHWASDIQVVAKVVVGINSSYVVLKTVYPC